MIAVKTNNFGQADRVLRLSAPKHIPDQIDDSTFKIKIRFSKSQRIIVPVG